MEFYKQILGCTKAQLWMPIDLIVPCGKGSMITHCHSDLWSLLLNITLFLLMELTWELLLSPPQCQPISAPICLPP